MENEPTPNSSLIQAFRSFKNAYNQRRKANYIVQIIIIGSLTFISLVFLSLLMLAIFICIRLIILRSVERVGMWRTLVEETTV